MCSSDLTAVRARLAQAGIALSAYEADQRRQLAMNQLAGVVGASDFLTPKEVERLQLLRGEQRELRFALLTPQQFGAGPAPAVEAIDACLLPPSRGCVSPSNCSAALIEAGLAL